MLISMCSDDSSQVRKLALENLHMDSQNLTHFIRRIRDFDPEIQILTIKKMISKCFDISKILKKSDLYKFIYDGMFSREPLVIKECIQYLKSINQPSMELEHISIQENFNWLRQVYQNFIKSLSLKNCLFYPLLQKAIDVFLENYFLNITTIPELKLYIKELFSILCQDFKQLTSDEYYVIRVLCSISQNEIKQFIYEIFPSGVHLSQILLHHYDQKDILGAYQTLRLIYFDITNDEFSKNKLKQILHLILCREEFEISIPDYDQLGHNEVFTKLEINDIYCQKMIQMSFEKDILVQNSTDLVPLICDILRKIQQPQEYIDGLRRCVDFLDQQNVGKNQIKYKITLELLKSSKSDLMSKIMQDYISPNFVKEQDSIVKDILMQNLFVYCYHNKHFCQEYTNNVIQGINQINLKKQIEPNEICMFIGLFDLILVHKQDVSTDYQYLIDVLIICMLKSTGLLRQICIEGFCKIVINDIHSNPSQIITQLILVWNDKNQDQKGIQILSSFFKKYTQMSLQSARYFEQGLEGIIIMQNVLFNKNQTLQNNYIDFQIHDQDSISQILKAGVGLLSYGCQKDSPAIKELMYIHNIRMLQNKYKGNIFAFGPQEEFFTFMCKVNSSELSKVFEKLFDNFDFFKILNQQLLSILRQNIAPILQKSLEISEIKRKTFYTDVLKYLKEISLNNQDELSKKEQIILNQDFNSHFEKKLQYLNEQIFIMVKNLEDVGVVICQEENIAFINQNLQLERRHFSKK